MKGKIYLALFCATWFGICAYVIVLFVAPELAAWAGCFAVMSTFVLLLEFLIFNDKLYQRKYFELESRISSPVFLKVNGNFDLEKGVRNGNIYFCETGICVASVEAKPYYFVEVPISDIDRYEFEDVKMEIYLVDGRRASITTADIGKIIEELKQRKWIASLN